MDKSRAQRYRDPVATMEADVVGTRSGILTAASGGVGDKKGRRRRIGINTVELNRNQTPDQY